MDLVLVFPPLPDPDALLDDGSELDSETKLIQSLRGFACGVSLLIPAFHFLLAAEAAYPTAEAAGCYPRLVMAVFMREAMLDSVLLHLRRLFEADSRSLAAGAIGKLLAQPDLQEELRRRSQAAMGDRAPTEEEFKGRVTAILVSCLAHLQPASEFPLLARVYQQVRLARRAANKRAAHITLDEYTRYNAERPHQALGYKTPDQHHAALAA